MPISTTAEILIFKITSEKGKNESRDMGFPSFSTKFAQIAANGRISHALLFPRAQMERTGRMFLKEGTFSSSTLLGPALFSQTTTLKTHYK